VNDVAQTLVSAAPRLLSVRRVEMSLRTPEVAPLFCICEENGVSPFRFGDGVGALRFRAARVSKRSNKLSPNSMTSGVRSLAPAGRSSQCRIVFRGEASAEVRWGGPPGLRDTPSCRFSVAEETFTIRKGRPGGRQRTRGSAPPRCQPSRTENYAALGRSVCATSARLSKVHPELDVL